MLNLAVLPFLLPVLSGLLGLAFHVSTNPRRQFFAISALLQVLLTGWLVWKTYHFPPLVLQLGGWLPPFGICLVIDLMASILLFMTAIITLVCQCYGYWEQEIHEEHALRLPLIQLMVAGVQLSFITGDIFNLYVALEILLIASFALMTFETEEGLLIQSVPYLTINLFASAILLCGVAVVYSLFGTLNMADLGRILLAEGASPKVRMISMILVIVFGLKAAIFPLYFWLPESYPIMSYSLAGLFAGLLTKVGVYVILRLFATVLPPDLPAVHYLVICLSVATMVLGVLGAVSKDTIKGILSYHSISQIGYMTLAIGYLTSTSITASLYYTVHHGFVKTALFLLGGAAAVFFQTDRLPRISGLFTAKPWLAALFLTSALSLSGIPPLSGFWGKYLVVIAGFREGYYWASLVAVFTGLFTLISMLKIWNQVFWKPRQGEIVHQGGEQWPKRLWVAGILVAFMLFMSIGAEPWVKVCSKAADQLLDRNIYYAAVFPEGRDN